MFIRDEGRGTLLTDVPEFCTSEPKDQQDCVTSLKSGGPECVSLHLISYIKSFLRNDDAVIVRTSDFVVPRLTRTGEMVIRKVTTTLHSTILYTTPQTSTAQ